MARLAFEAQDVVGESILWDDRRARLIWVDIIGQRIHALDPESGAHLLWKTPGRVTSIGLRQDGGAIVGLERQIALWDWDGPFRPMVEVEPDLPGNRLNEGCVGPDGKFWVGTMANNINDDDSARDPGPAAGSLYRLDGPGKLTRLTNDVFGITNTLIWPKTDRLITADTLANEVYAYEIDRISAQLINRKTLLSGFHRGLPDGSCIDSNGCIWSARVAGGGCLTRMTQEGQITDVIDLPCSWPTSCTFGGPDLETLYVTSARFTMSPQHLAENPQEGAVFAIAGLAKGLTANRWQPFE